MCCLTFVRPENYFMSPPNTDDWVNPDIAFAPNPPLKSASDDVPVGDIAECHKNVNELVEKYSKCERALQTAEAEGNCEKEKGTVKEVTDPQEQCSHEKNGAKAYLQRFIHLLLEVSNLHNVEVQPDNWAKLKFSISSDHLHTLRKFAREGDVKSVPLRKLDEILGSVLVKPYFSLPEFRVGDILDKLPSLHIGSFFISGLLPAVWFLSILFLTRNITKSFIWLIPVVFLTSYLTTISQMFEEALVKQYEEMKRYSDMPPDCNSYAGQQSLMFWASGGGKCSQFMKAHHMDPNLGITPFKVVTKMCGESIADTMRYFGSGTFGFMQNFEEMGFFSKLWVLPMAFAVLYAFAVLLFLVITGGTARLPFFMGSFSFNKPAMRHQDESYHSDPRDTAALLKTEPLPSSSNITVNINSQVPLNMQELLATISRGVLPSNQHAPPHPSISAHHDPLAGGDADHSNVTNQSHLRPAHVSFGSKKIHKQFSQLSSKYKSGVKSSNKLMFKRARNLSL